MLKYYRGLKRILSPNFLRLLTQLVKTEFLVDQNKRDWRGNQLRDKAHTLLKFTLNQKETWQSDSKKVLQALEWDNHTVSKNKKLLGKLIKMQYDPGFNVPLMSLREMFNIFLLVEKVKSVPGDLAEVGVYRAASAKLIREADKSKTLHLFDTFGGLPQGVKGVDILNAGEMTDTSLLLVKESLKKYKKIHYYQGLFPETISSTLHKKKFSFVNLDTDLYEGTLAGLKFFYPRLTKNGIIVTHDYSSINCPGVKKAFDEFFADKKETPVEIWDSQAMIVKY
jgi:O-methyltransferase